MMFVYGALLMVTMESQTGYVQAQTWTNQNEMQQLRAKALDVTALFGYSVAVSGDTAVIGAKYAEPGSVSNTGAAYVYERSGGHWFRSAMLTPSDGEVNGYFGHAVAIEGNIIAVTALNGDAGPSKSGTIYTDVGAVYVFTRATRESPWVQKARLAIESSNKQFGYSLAINRETLVVGYRGPDSYKGRGYIYTPTDTTYSTWTSSGNACASYSQYMLASDGASYDYFGGAVDISGNKIIVGAYGNDDAGSASGSAYVFERGLGASCYGQVAKLTATDLGSSDFFGYAVAISGDTAVVGAHGFDVGSFSSAGKVYIFTTSGSTWTNVQSFEGTGANKYFGRSVAISGNILAVGATGEQAVYVYKRVGNTWSPLKKLTATTTATSDNFGLSVAINGDSIIVGAPYADDTGRAGSNSGAVYAYSIAEMEGLGGAAAQGGATGPTTSQTNVSGGNGSSGERVELIALAICAGFLCACVGALLLWIWRGRVVEWSVGQKNSDNLSAVLAVEMEKRVSVSAHSMSIHEEELQDEES